MESELYQKGLELMRRMYADGVGDMDVALPPDDTWHKELVAWCYGHLMQERNVGVLDVKTKALCAVAMLTCLGKQDMLSTWIEGSLNLGCTIEEVREIIISMTSYTGVPAVRDALATAEKVLSSRPA
jgi:4-carboxymuconolactone decarboxylase